MKNWHDESGSRCRAILDKAVALRWLVDISANHCQLSYLILSDTGIAIPAREVQHVLPLHAA
ncbi:hypothetical protein [Rhizobium leguminosarum]|uniref:hypothetical protein n=1 Tax=Rhizobium leguminosarum TaxID=384 RepID=UPI001FEFD9C5|nr:hypothetical protein [Rhizobium leguminosarum]